MVGADAALSELLREMTRRACQLPSVMRSVLRAGRMASDGRLERGSRFFPRCGACHRSTAVAGGSGRRAVSDEHLSLAMTAARAVSRENRRENHTSAKTRNER